MTTYASVAWYTLRFRRPTQLPNRASDLRNSLNRTLGIL